MFEFYTHSFTLTLYTHSGEYNTQIEECKSLHHRSSITPSVILSVRLLCMRHGQAARVITGHVGATTRARPPAFATWLAGGHGARVRAEFSCGQPVQGDEKDEQSESVPRGMKQGTGEQRGTELGTELASNGGGSNGGGSVDT